jgi:YVTN family beta-propeller protein
MPYSEGTRLPGERASRLSHLDILKSPVVKKFVNSFESLHLEIDSKEVTWQKMIMDENPMRLIFGIDGSFQTISSDTRPTKQLSFVKTALLKIDKSALSKIDREFPHPLILKDILSNSALYHATVFPLKNVSIDGMNTYHSIRHAIFESIKDDSLKGEIMNTLKWIVYEKWNNNKKDVPDFECPHCNKTVASLPYNAEVGLCRNCKKELLLTDMLGFHQVMGEDFAPESVATDYMNISVIDTNTFGLIDTDGNAGNGITPITVGLTAPQDIAVDEGVGSNKIYVTHSGDDLVSVIDTNNFAVTPIDLPDTSNSFSVAYDSEHDTMYVTDSIGDNVFVINTSTNAIIDTITQADGIGEDPFGIAYDPDLKRMYVVNNFDGTVSVINTSDNTVIDTDGNAGNGITPITVGSQPALIAYDLINHEMYVANAGDDSVSVIDTTTNKVIDTITVGDFPTDIAYDIIHERMYVTNQGDSTVSVINLCL